jgi:hypothetical protein
LQALFKQTVATLQTEIRLRSGRGRCQTYLRLGQENNRVNLYEPLDPNRQPRETQIVGGGQA